MTRSLRLAAIIAVIAATFVALPEEAAACSCEYPSPREWLTKSDGAFIGELVALPEDERRGERGVIEGDYIFRVERAVKGEFPDTIAVRAPLDGAACGFELRLRQRIGLFLYVEESHWKSNLCSQIAADVLLAAAEPLPEPDGEGPIVALASIVTSEGRTVALDAAGKTLAYGAGRGEVAAFALCPGARTVIEHVFERTPDGLSYLIGVRDLRGFHVVREVAGPEVPGVISVKDIDCLDPAGDEILLFATWDEGDDRNGRIVRVRGDAVEVVVEFPEQSDCYGVGALDVPNEAAYFTGGPECEVLYRHDMASGATTKLVHIPASVSGQSFSRMTLSRDGRFLALEEHPGPRRQSVRLLIVNVQADPVSFGEAVYRDSLHASANFWLAHDRYLLTGPAKQGRALIVDPQLNTVAAIDELPGGPGGILDETIYVMGFGGRLVSAPAGGGEARELRTFLDPDVHAFVVLPQGVSFDPSATGVNNVAAAPAADAEQAGSAASNDTQETGALTTGRMVSATIVVLTVGAAGVLLVTSRRARRGSAA